MTLTLTIYTDDFDTKDGISNGFSGNVFLEGRKRFSDGGVSRNLGDALKEIRDLGPSDPVDEILFCYRDGDAQWFRKFVVGGPVS